MNEILHGGRYHRRSYPHKFWYCSDRQYSDSYILLPMHMMFPRLSVPPFPPLKFDPVFSSPAIFTHALWSRVFQSCLFHPCDLVPRFPVLTFPVPRFQSPPFHYVCVCMCLTASHAPSPMSCAKTTEPIEMPYGVCTLMGPINHVFGGSGSPPPAEMDTLCIEHTLAHPGLPTAIQSRRYSQR